LLIWLVTTSWFQCSLWWILKHIVWIPLLWCGWHIYSMSLGIVLCEFHPSLILLSNNPMTLLLWKLPKIVLHMSIFKGNAYELCIKC
jgi:hypothetical protein